MRKILRNPYHVYLAVITLLAITPILAPILLKLGESAPIFETIAKVIYLIYSLTCHQFHHRSLHLFDYQFAWCARDTGIWLGILVVAIAARKSSFTGIKWYWVLPFIVLMALDGGIQTIATLIGIKAATVGSPDILYVSNNLVRFLTGACFGVGVSLWLSPMLRETFKNNFEMKGKFKLKMLPVIAVVIMTIYAAFVQAWNLTSVDYKPTDILDTAVKTPSGEFFARRANAVCPTTNEDIFNLDCFF